jgi:3-keto-L-gulonate-6-phosphate decarboxylase
MALHAAIAENDSLPVFSSTKPQSGASTATVQFDMQQVRSFQKRTHKSSASHRTLAVVETGVDTQAETEAAGDDRAGKRQVLTCASYCCLSDSLGCGFASFCCQGDI